MSPRTQSVKKKRHFRIGYFNEFWKHLNRRNRAE